MIAFSRALFGWFIRTELVIGLELIDHTNKVKLIERS